MNSQKVFIATCLCAYVLLTTTCLTVAVIAEEEEEQEVNISLIRDEAETETKLEMVMLFVSKKDPSYAMGVREGKVVMMLTDMADTAQQWRKDNSLGDSMQDTDGHGAFVLLNVATNRALRNAFAPGQELLITSLSHSFINPDVMWSQGSPSKSSSSGDTGEYRGLRIAVPDTNLQADIEHGDVFDGAKVIAWEWNGEPQQLWSLIPVSEHPVVQEIQS